MMSLAVKAKNLRDSRTIHMAKKDETKVIYAGRDPESNFGIVNPPVYHASTVLFPTADALEHYAKLPVKYGRHGTPGTFALEEAMSELEGGYKSALAPSGLAACTISLLAFLSTGDHLLMVDSVYGPTRAFCETTLKRMGIEVTYYDPLIGADIAGLIKPNTKVVYTESPGSRSFEIQDIPAISAAAKAHGDITVMMDNTWATPLYFKAFEHGVDISIHAATKYIVGHSDAMLGIVTTNKESWKKLRATHRSVGLCCAPDDAYLALRGIRTLAVRLDRHCQNAMVLCEWLKERPEVEQVLYPALPDDPGHEIWQRDFKGATGLFAFVLNEGTKAQSHALLDNTPLFGMGYSWGGFESLIVPNDVVERSVNAWTHKGPSFRIHAGLEDSGDLITDLQKGFDAFRKAK